MESTTGSGSVGGSGDTPVREGRDARGEIVIEAPVERVWQALTEAEELEAWFPLDARVEPGLGGRIQMSWGHEYDEGLRIEVWDPPRHLRTTWGWGGERPQITDYHLQGTDGSTTLRVVTSGFPEGTEWDDIVEGTRLGWFFELQQLKHYLERHAGKRRHAVFLRRRVPLERGEAWARLNGPGGVFMAEIQGAVLDHSPPWQFAAVLDDPQGGLLRVTVDPTHTDPDRRDVSVWLAAWGADQGALNASAERWRRVLDTLFPDAVTLDMAR